MRSPIDHVCQRPACRKPFQSRHTDSKYCTPACAQEMRRATYPERKCRKCGTTYRPHRGNRNKIYCTHECANAHRRKEEITCAAPGCEVRFRPHDGAIFCSRACSAPHQRRNTGGRTLPDRVCANAACGRTFRPSRAAAKFCSVPCSASGQARRGGTGPKLGEFRCANESCGRAFRPPNHRAKFCSRACVHESMRKAPAGRTPTLPPVSPVKVDIPAAPPKQPPRTIWRPASWGGPMPNPAFEERAS